MLSSKANESKQWPQVLAAMTCSFIAFGVGIQFGWPAQAIPKILSKDFGGGLTKEESSYILLIGPLSYIIAAPLFANLSDIIGRKKTLLMLAIPQLIGWILIANAKTLILFCIARLITSSSEAGVFAVFPMYVGEISEPKVRGILGSTISMSLLLGSLAIVAYGSYTSLTVSAYISCSFPLVFLLTFSWMPESPYFLVMKGKNKEAEESLKQLRRMENVRKEVMEVESAVIRQMSEPHTIKDLFTSVSNRRALVIMICLRSIQQLSGISAMNSYAQVIFGKDEHAILSPKISAIIFALGQLIVTVTASCFVDIFGRRSLFIISTILTTIVLYILSIYFYLIDNGYDLHNYTWLSLVCMILYIMFFSFGEGIAPNLMLSEMFSASVKAKALSICSIHLALCLSTTTQIFYLLEVNIGFWAPFAFFASCNLIGFIYSYFCMPETKGRSLEEIQMLLKGKN